MLPTPPTVWLSLGAACRLGMMMRLDMNKAYRQRETMTEHSHSRLIQFPNTPDINRGPPDAVCDAAQRMVAPFSRRVPCYFFR